MKEEQNVEVWTDLLLLCSGKLRNPLIFGPLLGEALSILFLRDLFGRPLFLEESVPVLLGE